MSTPHHRRTTRARAVALLVCLLLLTTGCSGGSGGKAPTAGDSATTAAPTAAPPPAAPPAHGCYDLDFAAALEPTTTAQPVACTAPHTAATIRVGTIGPVVDGHLLAVDSDSVQKQVADRCHQAFARQVGGDEETRRLSRLAVVWFTPTLADSDRGALWFRCDVVALAGHEQLATLPRSVRGILAADGALDRYGTCGTSAPGAAQFQRVICSRPHSWRARTTVDLPAHTRYLGKAAGAAADSTCHDVDARLAADSLKLRWSFEWPTKQEWAAGQRYGICWTPDPA